MNVQRERASSEILNYFRAIFGNNNDIITIRLETEATNARRNHEDFGTLIPAND